MAENKLSLADRIPDDECYTVEQIAQELGVSVPRCRQILAKVKQKKMIPWVVKKKGLLQLFVPDFVDQLKQIYAEGKLGKPRNVGKLASKNASLVIEVPIFDPQKADILTKAFKTEEEIKKFLIMKLDEISNPKLKRINDLKAKHQRELEEALSSL